MDVFVQPTKQENQLDHPLIACVIIVVSVARVLINWHASCFSVSKCVCVGAAAAAAHLLSIDSPLAGGDATSSLNSQRQR